MLCYFSSQCIALDFNLNHIAGVCYMMVTLSVTNCFNGVCDVISFLTVTTGVIFEGSRQQCEIRLETWNVQMRAVLETGKVQSIRQCPERGDMRSDTLVGGKRLSD